MARKPTLPPKKLPLGMDPQTSVKQWLKRPIRAGLLHVCSWVNSEHMREKAKA